jgi:hypothetical protein
LWFWKGKSREKSSLVFHFVPFGKLVRPFKRFLSFLFLDTVLKGWLVLRGVYPLKLRGLEELMRPEEHTHSFKKVSSNDYQAEMDLALSSQNENVREAIETSYSGLAEKKS